jgi:hypothetical protein
MLMQLYAVHQLEVAHLEETIARLTNQRSDAEPHVNESLWHDGDDPAPSGRSTPPPAMAEDRNLQGRVMSSPRLNAVSGDEPRERVHSTAMTRQVSFNLKTVPTTSGPDSFPEFDVSTSSEDPEEPTPPTSSVDDVVDHHSDGNLAALPDPAAGENRNQGEDSTASASLESARLHRSGGSQLQAKSECMNDEMGDLGRGGYTWQWQRTAGGFCNYPPSQNECIEEAYRRGHSKVRFKSGKNGTTPMEIFLVDMIQLDPQSRNLRAVRRLGPKSRRIEWWRHVQAFARSLFFGGPRWESFAKYKKRQHGLLGELANVDSMTSAVLSTTSSNFNKTYVEKADNICARITDSQVFSLFSMLFTSLNVIWLGVSVELGEFKEGMRAAHPLSIALELGFMLYFCAEIIIKLMSIKCKSMCVRIPWFRLDAVCTATMVLEVLGTMVLMVLAHHGTIIVAPSIIKQILRLTRLAWLLKLSDGVNDVVTALRGLILGLRSAAVIWIVIAVHLYTFSILLTATSDNSPFLRDAYFGSMGHTITSLVIHGIAMDGVSDLFYDLRMHNGLFQGLLFAMFVFLTYFGLLNMLVGTFCNVAIETAVREKDISEIRYLQLHLEGIVACYMEDGRARINGEKFQLIMKDADVLGTLQSCGTDIEGLLMLSDILFPREDSNISFEEFFSVIVRLRRGKPAGISEVIALQEFTKQQMDSIENLIRKGMSLKLSAPSVKTSVLNSGRLRRNIATQQGEIRPEQRSTSGAWFDPSRAAIERDGKEEDIQKHQSEHGGHSIVAELDECSSPNRADIMRQHWMRPQFSDLSVGSGDRARSGATRAMRR